MLKHTFVTADGQKKTVNIPDEVIVQGRKEGLNTNDIIERYLSDEGFLVNDTVQELTDKAKAAGVNNAGRVTGEKTKRKAPTRKPDMVKRALIVGLNEYLCSLWESDVTILNKIDDIEIKNIERIIAFSIGDDKYELTLSKKRKPKK